MKDPYLYGFALGSLCTTIAWWTIYCSHRASLREKEPTK